MEREDTKTAQVSWNVQTKVECKQQVFFLTAMAVLIQFLKAEKFCSVNWIQADMETMPY